MALKVARAGSREPQTLARLQHTHIVPVHSSRTDPATGLHLLWMPYFGRLTLARILADPQVRTARTGAELVEVLDRLGPQEGPPPGRAAGRAALARRSFAQAIAWWGARMAEALDHAHDRGVLHRDIKPSNVLVTGDGMPMLLDFNLAREPLDALDDAQAAPAALGGTLDYMAPEHLEALADGCVRAGRWPRRHLRPGRPPVRGADGRPAVLRAAERGVGGRPPEPRCRGAPPRGPPAPRRPIPRSPRRSRPWSVAAWLPSRSTATPARASWRPTSRRWPMTSRCRLPASPGPAASRAGSAAAAARWRWPASSSPRWPSPPWRSSRPRSTAAQRRVDFIELYEKGDAAARNR